MRHLPNVVNHSLVLLAGFTLLVLQLLPQAVNLIIILILEPLKFLLRLGPTIEPLPSPFHRDYKERNSKNLYCCKTYQEIFVSLKTRIAVRHATVNVMVNASHCYVSELTQSFFGAAPICQAEPTEAYWDCEIEMSGKSNYQACETAASREIEFVIFTAL